MTQINAKHGRRLRDEEYVRLRELLSISVLTTEHTLTDPRVKALGLRFAEAALAANGEICALFRRLEAPSDAPSR